MKKMILSFVCMILILSPVLGQTTGTQDENHSPARAVSTDPIWMLFNIYSLTYEQRVANQFSGSVGVIYSPAFLWGLHEYSTLTYFDLIGKGRYYFGHFLADLVEDVDAPRLNTYLSRMFTNALGGFYLGAQVGYVNSIVEKGTEDQFFRAAFHGYGGGLEIGLKYVFGNKKISFFAEPHALLRYYTGGYNYKDIDGNKIEKPEDFKDGFDRNGFSGGVNFGIVF